MQKTGKVTVRAWGQKEESHGSSAKEDRRRERSCRGTPKKKTEKSGLPVGKKEHERREVEYREKKDAARFKEGGTNMLKDVSLRIKKQKIKKTQERELNAGRCKTHERGCNLKPGKRSVDAQKEHKCRAEGERKHQKHIKKSATDARETLNKRRVKSSEGAQTNGRRKCGGGEKGKSPVVSFEHTPRQESHVWITHRNKRQTRTVWTLGGIYATGGEN